MKRTISCLSAAVFVLVLFAAPAMACHGTIGKQFKAENQVDYWEFCGYYDPGTGMPMPVGPAIHFGKDVLIHYVGEQDFTATDRLKNNVHKVTWKRNVEGTATVYRLPGSGGDVYARMSAAPRLTVTSEVSTAPIDILPWICTDEPITSTAIAAILDTPDTYKLYSAPFVVHEVVKDIGNDSGCFNANTPAPVNFLDCALNMWTWNNVEYLSYHNKIKGPMGYNWTMTIREPGKLCFDDKYGDYPCWSY